jgi:hypothetical protein
MNEKLMAQNNKVIKRIFNLDTNGYKEGHGILVRVNKKRQLRIG